MHSKISTALVLLGLGGCNGELAQPSPSTLRLAIRADDGLRRAPVYLDHGKHTDALGSESCHECHTTREGRLVLDYALTTGVEDADELMSLYHAGCVGCHRDRGADGSRTGPLACGGCHLERRSAPTLDPHRPRWDTSMHGRHVVAEGERCGTCHHVFDEQAQELVYAEGQESACRDCHGEVTEGNVLSWREAAHTNCVHCHRARDGETGPVLCAGCHDPAVVAGYETLADPPRIVRGQPDQVWLQADGARSPPVRFDHLGHEPNASICSDCHHQTLQACATCHTVTGSEKGGGVTLEAAYHDPDALHACVGCHDRQASQTRACAGCHASIARGPAERTCVICHRQKTDEIAPVELAALPEHSDNAYPSQVTIDFLVDRYGPSPLPHGAIVQTLDAAVRASELAATFHQSTETLCAGCHHHSPAGETPPPCRSCHSREADALDDKPGLRAAYHRQCIGCHEEMALGVGCEDCHQEVTR